MRYLFISMMAAVMLLGGCAERPEDTRGFVKVEDGRFVLDGEELSFVGTNFWYGPIIASEGIGGNRERLHKELDA